MSMAPLIFDCDGVLLDSEPLAMRAILEELATHGIAFDPQEAARRFVGATDAEVARMVTAESGHPLPLDFPERVAERALALFAGELRPMAGAAAFFASHRGPRAVASNSGQRRLERALAIAGLAPFFAPDRCVSQEQVARPKPAPDLYLHVAALFDRPPESCLVVEDSVTGATAAVAAGMTVIGFLGASGQAPDQADRLRAVGVSVLADNFAALPGVLTGLARN